MINLLKRLNKKQYTCIAILIVLFILEVNSIFVGKWSDLFSWIAIAIFVFSLDDN